MEDTNKCMACECPCDEHKEHTHGQEENKCMACKCPCDEHKEHTHGSKCEKCGHMHKEGGGCDCGC